LTIPAEVLAAYGLERATIDPIDVGLINETHEVSLDGAPRYVLQRLHTIFAGEVCLDLESIAEHVARAGIVTPRLVRTRDGDAFVRVGDAVFRVITFVPGRTITSVSEPRLAFEAASLASRFHSALADVEHTFHFTRSGVHDTAAHLARLERWLDTGKGTPDHALNAPIAEAILSHARALDPLANTPRRIVHGDLKISNVRFDETLTRAVALLDLDTLAHGTMAYELGDALRSWAQRGGESGGTTEVDHAIVEAAMHGYAAGGFPLTREERASIIPGLETISVELAARFCVDAWEDAYFGWDRTRYASRREHNRVRASSQLSLAASVRDARGSLDAIVQKQFSK
jgi:Ser/Thr protein kinase RdoA (MazF antagonist)